MTVTLAHVQNGASCLCIACQEAHLEVVKYLCEQGGKELLMLTSKVTVLRVFLRGIYIHGSCTLKHIAVCVNH